MRNLTDEMCYRIATRLLAADGIWTEQGAGEVRPEELDLETSLKDAALPELEKIIRHMNEAYTTLDIPSLGEEYLYLYQNALETLKKLYEDLYYELESEGRLPEQQSQYQQQAI